MCATSLFSKQEISVHQAGSFESSAPISRDRTGAGCGRRIQETTTGCDTNPVCHPWTSRQETAEGSPSCGSDPSVLQRASRKKGLQSRTSTHYSSTSSSQGLYFKTALQEVKRSCYHYTEAIPRPCCRSTATRQVLLAA